MYAQVGAELRKRGISAAHYHADMKPEARSSVHTRSKSSLLHTFCEADVYSEPNQVMEILRFVLSSIGDKDLRSLPIILTCTCNRSSIVKFRVPF
jgi:hypothetical protein